MRQSNLKIKTFKNRLLIFIVIIISILSLTNFFSFYFSKLLSTEYNDMLNIFFRFNSISNNLKQAEIEFGKYIQNSSQANMDNYFNYIQTANAELDTAINQIYDEDMYYKAVGLKNLINTYGNANDRILAITALNSSSFYDELMESNKYFDYIVDRLDKLNDRQVILGYDQYNLTSSQFGTNIIISILVIVGLIIFSYLIALRFTRRTTDPLLRLTAYASAISSGEFDMEDIDIKSTHEVDILTSTLNKLKNNVRQMIGEINRQTEVEAMLREKELENLRITSNLRDAELKMLQSQINPHFLFNTLNSIGRMAQNEGANNATLMIEAVSEMLRYNLKNIDKPETIEGEVNNLKRYMFIQETRFAGKLKFSLAIESKHMDWFMPCLTLQPIVENSISHGLRLYDYHGSIEVRINDQDEHVIITISDNGVGMDEETTCAILSDHYQPSDSSSTGIGIRNVLNRLRAFFKTDDCLQISSAVGEGTTIKIIVGNVLPQEAVDEETADR